MTDSFDFLFSQCFAILGSYIAADRQAWQVCVAQVFNKSVSMDFVKRFHADCGLGNRHLSLCIFEVVIWRSWPKNTSWYDLILDNVAEPRLLTPVFR